MDNLEKNPYETIGFELIFPPLMADAEKRGLNLPYGDPSVLKCCKIREKKLGLIPEELKYSAKTTLSYSMEFLGDDVDTEKIKNAQLPNGSLGTSPSATAYMFEKTKDPDAYGYLKKALDVNKDGSVFSQYPFEIFETAWCIYNLAISSVPIDDYVQNHLDSLARAMTPRGVCWSSALPIADSDDTALTMNVMKKFGKNVDFAVLERYEKDEYFTCFEFEINASLSANIHVLDLVKDCAGYPRRSEVMEKIIYYLARTAVSGNHWDDKWHISPHYATSAAIIALSGLDDWLTARAVGWFLDCQNPDGSWGLHGGSVEETAYALQALLHYNENVERIDTNKLGDGINWLSRNAGRYCPQFWIAKGLYGPVNVVKMAALGVLYSSETNRGASAAGSYPISAVQEVTA